MRPNRILRAAGAAVLALLVLWHASRTASTDMGARAASALDAYEAQRSGVMIEAEGRVSRILADDTEGSRHQRFILALDGGHTLLISHNIDLAPRVPVVVGDRLELRGQYEWNEQGGVVHWTHHDPQGQRVGGWIRRAGQEYR